MKLSIKAAEVRLVVGGESRIDLLPPEVAARVQARSTRRAMSGVVVISLLLSVGGAVLASVGASEASAELADARAESTSLISQQLQYIDVKNAEAELDTVEAAQAVGTSTEIDWQGYLSAVSATLPGGAVLTGFAVESATPLETVTVVATPLQGERVATITLSANTADLPSTERWLDALVALPGYVDATPGKVTQLTGDGQSGFQLSVIMHIDSQAYSGRFAPAAADATSASLDDQDER